MEQILRKQVDSELCSWGRAKLGAGLLIQPESAATIRFQHWLSGIQVQPTAVVVNISGSKLHVGEVFE